VVGGRAPRPTGPGRRAPVGHCRHWLLRCNQSAAGPDECESRLLGPVPELGRRPSRHLGGPDHRCGGKGAAGEDHLRGHAHEDSLATRTLRCVENRARSHRWLHLANRWTHAL